MLNQINYEADETKCRGPTKVKKRLTDIKIKDNRQKTYSAIIKRDRSMRALIRASLI